MEERLDAECPKEKVGAEVERKFRRNEEGGCVVVFAGEGGGESEKAVVRRL